LTYSRRARMVVGNIRANLRGESTMTLAWIAERLRMGTKTYLAHLLYWNKRDKSKREASCRYLVPIPLQTGWD